MLTDGPISPPGLYKETPMNVTETLLNAHDRTFAKPEKKEPRPKAKPETLSRVMEDAMNIVKTWENATPASRSLFLTMIKVVEKE